MLSTREKPISTCRTYHNPLPPSPELGLFSPNQPTHFHTSSLCLVASTPPSSDSIPFPVSFMEDAPPSHHRQQRLCRIELLGIRIQCGLLHLSVREEQSKSSWPAPHHPDTHPPPHPTHSATGPSSLSSPLMRPTGGLPVWLGQGGGS